MKWMIRDFLLAPNKDLISQLLGGDSCLGSAERIQSQNILFPATNLSSRMTYVKVEYHGFVLFLIPAMFMASYAYILNPRLTRGFQLVADCFMSLSLYLRSEHQLRTAQSVTGSHK